ncbi:MAG: DUF2318 domain-containing protein [Firmicutes bacterium]|nr:DUF2318 domain-containing protein [Bacillota bacterium]MBQ9707613.1 DUF2318 domain-containing protein [Bacillota bacterium]
MLKYLVLLTEDLIIAALLVCMIYAFIRFNMKKRDNLIALGVIGVSLIASIVMAILLNTTNKVNIGYVNLTMFILYIAFFILFIVFNLTPIRNKLGMISEIGVLASGAVMIFTLLFYSLPDAWAYPYNFDLSGNTLFSTDFIYRFIGWLGGFLLSLVAGVAAYKILKHMELRYQKVFLYVVLLINALSFAGKAVQIMRTRMLIPPSDLTFNIIKLTLNYSDYFIYASILAVVIAAAILIANSRKVTSPYANNAQFRKLKAALRNRRRWSTCLIVCAIFAMVNLTVVDAYNNREPDEAPVEECQVTDTDMIVPLEMVADGHLHRFGYTTDEGILVKFIVVQKPGTTAYGVGLDACDICGDAGYYERDDEVVCKRCDVVMNKNTIGFKGGCNPIIIDYSVKDGQIIVPIETLVDHANEFK